MVSTPLLALLYGFILLTAAVAVFLEDLLSSFISLSVMGVLMATVFALLRAPDVALTQAIINSGLVTSLLLVAYSQTRKTPRPPEICAECAPWLRWRITALVCGLLAALLFRGFLSLAAGRPLGTASSHFLSATLRDTGGKNVVGAILLDYRPSTPGGDYSPSSAAVSGVSLLLSRRRQVHSGYGLSFIVKRGKALLTALYPSLCGEHHPPGHLPREEASRGKCLRHGGHPPVLVYGTRASRRPGFRRRARRPLKREGALLSCS